MHDGVCNHAITCTKKHVPRFLILEALTHFTHFIHFYDILFSAQNIGQNKKLFPTFQIPGIGACTKNMKTANVNVIRILHYIQAGNHVQNQ